MNGVSSAESIFAGMLPILRLVATSDGIIKTAIPFLSIIRVSKPTPLEHGLITPSFCILIQGRKEVHIGKEIFRYGPGNYLASMIDMPMAGHVIGATKEDPYFGIKIDLSNEEIASVIREAKLDIKPQKKLKPNAFVASGNTELLETFWRLIKLLTTPHDAAFLSPLLKREIIYRLLSSEEGSHFYQNTILDPNIIGIDKAISWIKKNYVQPLAVKELAESCNMSVSSLHHKFKTVTTMAPLQYQKQLRLQEARRLLVNGLADATTAAMGVGYESPSQFSREYRRLFGMPPLKDSRMMQKNMFLDNLVG